MDESTLDELFAQPGSGDPGRRAGVRSWLHLHGPRGSGKSWWAAKAAQRATALGIEVVRLDADVDADVSVGATALVIADDVDRHPALQTALLRSSASAVLTTGRQAVEHGDVIMHRLSPLRDEQTVAILVARGLMSVAAVRCAAAAAGNPGLALAIADGLSDEQRAGHRPIGDLPRLPPSTVGDMLQTMRGLGERACRALMVAAADEEGGLLAIHHALTALGEDPADCFAAAESAGVVELVDSQVLFASPWERLTAYHLLAAPSRRAAHRALAEAYTAPRQAVTRVRHLVSASSGPSDDVAAAAIAVSVALARQERTADALLIARRAADLASDPDIRSSALLHATSWALNAGRYAHAAELAESMDMTREAEIDARAEVEALLLGDGDFLDAPVEPPARERYGAEQFRDRTDRRRRWWRAAAEGRVAMLRTIPASGQPAEEWARALLLRHSGDVRRAAELTEHMLASTAAEPSAVRQRWLDLADDIAVLTGEPLRSDHRAHPSIDARQRLAVDPDQRWTPLAVLPSFGGPLGDVRERIRAAIVTADAAGLFATAEEAAELGLVIESGEALAIGVEIAASRGEARNDMLDRALQRLHRCGVVTWSARLSALPASAAQAPPHAAAVTVDAAYEQLSTAERRVAEAIAKGMTNRQAAAELFLALKTIDFHLQQIYRKLGIRTRAELAVRVAASGALHRVEQNGAGR